MAHTTTQRRPNAMEITVQEAINLLNLDQKGDTKFVRTTTVVFDPKDKSQVIMVAMNEHAR
jgi:hypothetical protein